MNPAFVYPQSRFEPAALIDLRSNEERTRLSPLALKGFFNIVQRWQLKNDEARELLGSVSSSTYYEIKKNPTNTLDVDRITRVPRWPLQTPPPLAGQTPPGRMG